MFVCLRRIHSPPHPQDLNECDGLENQMPPEKIKQFYKKIKASQIRFHPRFIISLGQEMNLPT